MTKEDVNDPEVDEEKEVLERRITNLEDAQVRFDENLKVMKKEWPGLIRQFETHVPMSELVFLDNDEPDLLFKGISLYNGVGAYTFAREQIDASWKTSNRFYTAAPELNGLDLHAGEAFADSLNKIGTEIRFFGHSQLRDPKHCYYLISLGIGFGLHLRELLEATRAKVLLLVESNFDFMYHSLFICDWAAFFAVARKNDIRIELMHTSDTREIANSFGGIFRKYNPTTLDGAMLYQHYASSAYLNAYRVFMEKVYPITMMGLGFFEDELYMISQTYENLSTGKCRTIRMIQEPTLSSLPVFIVGNGPSIDGHFEHLRKLQDRVIIISCGTAIDALLTEGITPDFHIQMERNRSALQLYQYTAKNHDLSSVCLVATTTICPGIADLFGEAVYFFRPGLSPMPIFKTSDQERLENPDPTVANAALSMALHLGLKTIYFFGTDMGAKDADHHHSKSSLYDVKHDELPSYMDTTTSTDMPSSFNVKVPANFGGTVLTSGILQWTRSNLEGAIASNNQGRFFYNCSDGALIEGALPMMASRVKVPEAPLNKKIIVSGIIDKFPIYERATFEAKWDAADIYNNLEKMAENLISTMDEFPNLEDMQYSRSMMTYLKPGSSSDAAAMIYRGSVWLYQISMHYYLNRAASDEMAEKLREIYKEDLTALIYRIRDEAVTYYKEAENGEIDYAAGD